MNESSTPLQRFDLAGQDFKRDPFPTFAAMRQVGSLVDIRMPLVGQATFATTHAACETLLKDTEAFSVELRRARRAAPIVMLVKLPGLRPLVDNMLQRDGTEHRRLRKLVDGVFRRQEIDKLTGRIETIADRLLDDLAASEDGDLVRHVARDLPLAVICDMLGLPQSDRPKFTRWMGAMSEAKSVWSIGRFLPSIWRINGYLRARFEERRREPRDDLISALVHAEDAGDRLTDDELLAMCFLLFVAGHETTTHLISGGVLALLQNPDQLARLRAEPDLAPSAVDELLRFVSPVQVTKPRFATDGLVLEGRRFEKGHMLVAFLASANTDPAVFEAPEVLDLGREKNRHLAFGGGPHFCLGAWLARKEMEVLLRRLLDRAPELQLAVPERDLRWTGRTGMRALISLPLRL